MKRATHLMVVAAVMSTMALTGCEKKKEAPPPVVTAPPPPPAPVVHLDDIKMDPRVQFPDTRLPSTQELAEAIASLANAIAKGDSAALGSLLDDADRTVLKDMDSAGEFKRGTSGIEAVRVSVLRESDDKQSAEVGLGIQDKEGAYLLGWKGVLANGSWTFHAMAIAPTSAARVSMLDDEEMIDVGGAAPAAATPAAPTTTPPATTN